MKTIKLMALMLIGIMLLMVTAPSPPDNQPDVGYELCSVSPSVEVESVSVAVDMPTYVAVPSATKEVSIALYNEYDTRLCVSSSYLYTNLATTYSAVADLHIRDKDTYSVLSDNIYTEQKATDKSRPSIRYGDAIV